MSTQIKQKDMTELALPLANQDPAVEAVREAREFFTGEFGLQLDANNQLVEDANDGQLDALRAWREETFVNGIEMPDTTTFYRKVLLAQALMPQRDTEGRVTYLFGKGGGAEISLQGQAVGREKHIADVPYRTHADFEIYAFDVSDPPAGYDNFRRVFGSQEVYPESKGVTGMPEGYMLETAQEVDLGGMPVFVPRLEVQFVDKNEKGNERVERRLRGYTDAEFLAGAYDLDRTEVHGLIDANVIHQALEKFDPRARIRNLRKNAVLLGHDSIENATISIGPGTTFSPAEYGLTSEQLLKFDEAEAIALVSEAATKALAQKHDHADVALDAYNS